MAETRKTKTQQNAYIDQKIYENNDNEVTAEYVNKAVKSVVEATQPSHDLLPSLDWDWEPGEILLRLTTLSDLTQIPTLSVSVGATINIVVGNKKYRYILKSATTATESPNFFRPDDYQAGTNQKVWCLVGERVKTFTAADLADGKLTYAHNLDDTGLHITIKDPNNIYQPASQQISEIDSNTIEIDFGGAVEAGTWTLYIKI